MNSLKCLIGKHDFFVIKVEKVTSGHDSWKYRQLEKCSRCQKERWIEAFFRKSGEGEGWLTTFMEELKEAGVAIS